MHFRAFLVCILFSIYNCSGGKPGQSEYWKHFYATQSSLRKIADDNEKWKIANGSLSPEQEHKLKTNQDRLYLFFESEKKGNQVEGREKTLPQNLDSYPYSYLYSEYFPSKFQNKETYLFKRILRIKSQNVFHPQDFLTWIKEMQSLDNPKIYSETNPLFLFICNNFQCDIQDSEKQWTISLTPSQNLKKLDPNFYNRIYKLLDRVEFSLNFSNTEQKQNIFLILSDSKKIKIIWNRESQISEKLQSASLQTDLKVNFFGLKIDIQNWRYGFQFQKNGKSSLLTGKFINIPKYKVSGRLGYILPKGLVNLFIPEDMDDYFSHFFSLRHQGNSGKGHIWSIQIKSIQSGEYEIISKTESEIPRKVFQFLGGNEKSEKEIFMEAFQQKLIESLL